MVPSFRPCSNAAKKGFWPGLSASSSTPPKRWERLNGLDLFFKTEVPKERRGQVKGIKAEVAQIRTIMGNANKQRHEAVARREESEQLKRLGIKS